ncbi:MAG: hypothetical protein JWL87_729 [Candidatus Adlerbacteria bacterium]|nr:hypothetical protein [Candidatus Adlerbacteria bacterium]
MKSLVILAALVVGGTDLPPKDTSLNHKHRIVRLFVDDTSACVARAVFSDPRYGKADLGELIVDSIEKCAVSVQALIRVYDRQFGEGKGEKFFMGEYLDALTRMLSRVALRINL